MYGSTEFNQQGNFKLQTITMTVRSEAHSSQGNSLALLALLRLLESLHREIRDSLFQESLPNNRQALYALLQNIEEQGGWPYIHRMKLRSLLANLAENTSSELEPEKSTKSSVKRESSKPLFSCKQGEIT